MLQEILFNTPKHIVLGKMLDTAALKQRVISANIANVGTPGYQRLGVVFQDELVRALGAGANRLSTTHPNHIPGSSRLMNAAPEVVLIDDGYFNGVNNVNIEEEMVELGKNQLDFDTAAQFIKNDFTDLRAAIRGGR